ncbi:SdpI family protein [Flavobacteriaceae bacterium F89]|uniref:SdpI family protein n=2 Tax=Cerina litoralis TaxID=2874477 RepID=A0AAE3ETW5_9FLAO|nr:SdpI family protein [Cerina litoralis]
MGILKIFPPKNINSWYGYRTRNSKKNMRNWVLAQKTSANIGLVVSIIVILYQILIDMIFEQGSLTRFTTMVLWSIGMVLTIYLTERKLKGHP